MKRLVKLTIAIHLRLLKNNFMSIKLLAINSLISELELYFFHRFVWYDSSIKFIKNIF